METRRRWQMATSLTSSWHLGNVVGSKGELPQVLGDLHIEKDWSKNTSVGFVREGLAHDPPDGLDRAGGLTVRVATLMFRWSEVAVRHARSSVPKGRCAQLCVEDLVDVKGIFTKSSD